MAFDVVDIRATHGSTTPWVALGPREQLILLVSPVSFAPHSVDPVIFVGEVADDPTAQATADHAAHVSAGCDLASRLYHHHKSWHRCGGVCDPAL